MNVEELLNQPEVAQFIATHQGATAKNVRCAAEYLKECPDALKALKKVLPALDDKVVKVFFSYKKKDEATAKKIIDLLSIHSAEKLNIISMATFEKDIPGKLYDDFIRNEICSANWFLLLLPDPSEDWDWCLYEAGLFAAQITSADRLICIHHPDTDLPSQIDKYQAIPAKKEHLENFLRGVYLEENPVPGMKALNRAIESEIGELAEKIEAVIQPPRKNTIRQPLPPWIVLKINKPLDLTDDSTLDQSSIVTCNNEALRLFHFLQNPKTWGRLRSKIVETDSRWRTELVKTIKAIGEGEMFEPGQAVFKSLDGKIHRPFVCAVDRIGDEEGPIERYHVAFIEEVGVYDSSSLPELMPVLASVLRFSFRFRWEVLETFSKEGMTVDDVTKLENTLLRMRSDWLSRGTTDISTILRCFSPVNAIKVKKIMQQWQTVRNIEGNGALDIAIQNKDVTTIPRILKELIPISQEFLEISADRFSEMVAGK